MKRMDRELRKALLAKLGVTRQRLSKRAEALKQFVPMTSTEAAYCLAYEEGLPLDKYLPPSAVSRVRELLRALHLGQPLRTKRRHKRLRNTQKARAIILAGGIRLPDPILPPAILDDAAKMATTAYPMLYVFENSVRHSVAIMLSNKFGADWWNKAAIPEGLKDSAAQRDAQWPEAWNSARVTHPIYSTEARDLIAIVHRNWVVFSKLFPRKDWFADLVRSIDLARNTVAHMTPLRERDLSRLRKNLSDWWELLQEKIQLLRSALPPANAEQEDVGRAE